MTLDSDHKFLDENIERNRLDDYYCFKDGYTPTYSQIELRASIYPERTNPWVLMEMQKRKQEEEEERRRIAAAELERARPRTPGVPQPGDWLQDQRTFDALIGMELYVFVRNGPHRCLDKDRRVFLKCLDPREVLPGYPTIHVVSKKEADIKKLTKFSTVRILPSDICVPDAAPLPNGHPICLKVPQSGEDATSLYFVYKGDHFGKIGRRVSFVKPPPDALYTSTGRFILQRVEFERERGNRGWKLTESVTGEAFEVHRNALVVIHEPSGIHSRGEKLIEPYRAEYLKLVLPEFTPLVVPTIAYTPMAGPMIPGAGI